MSLSSSLNTAISSLATTAEQTSVLSRNVARAGDPTASRKIANVITIPGAGVRLASVTRVVNVALFNNVLSSTSSAAGHGAIVNALEQLEQTINDTELDASPAALLQKLSNAIQQYSSAPDSLAHAQAAVGAARDIANALNRGNDVVQDVRNQADADLGGAVDNLNTLLARFESVNTQIVKGTRAGSDVTDYLDQRDQLLKEISEEVGIRTVTRGDNDMAIYTDSGVTLFDVAARQITFQRSPFLSATMTGNAVYADGVPITGTATTMGINSGRIHGLAQVRDEIAVTYQSQLDEIARGLINAFAESDQSPVPLLPDVAGLFTWSGDPALPGNTLTPGLAGSIRISAAVDPDQGGDAMLVRDGGIGGAAYVYNSSGVAGYTGRLDQLIDKMSAPQVFDPAAKLSSSATLGNYASTSAAWLEEARRSAGAEADYRETLLIRSTESLNKITGVNLDEEMTLMLELERTFQASSKLISTINAMLDSLLAAVR
ncbi:MAG TPA: flagellar hook-associated protein FlgK [Hyphomicrobium sp.]|nr:flagellar hook-associated protein FlgK [Hyphomicrobium sp.]